MGPTPKKKRTSEFHGILLVDKPAGMTSHDVVDCIRRIFSTRRVGHTGTLDPRATGLLVMLLGEATKISEYLVGCDKTYEGTLRLGVVSDTYDVDGEIVPGPGGKLPKSIEDLQGAADDLTGEIDQLPPPYSAKKVAGKRLYEYARKGQQPEDLKPRRVTVQDFEILAYTDDAAEFAVDCSSGTYIRSLVHDLGQALGCGGIMTELNRTDVGNYRLEDAYLLGDLEKLTAPADLRECILPIASALPDIPALYLLPDAERWLRSGQAIPHSMVHSEDDSRPARGSKVQLLRLNGESVAIARVDPAPASPPPRSMAGSPAPWYQPLKQFDIDVASGDDEQRDDEEEAAGGEDAEP